MNEFIIVFRESLEACLIVGIIFTLLEKNNKFIHGSQFLIIRKGEQEKLSVEG
jgi:high-affinity Fe2+/Pb2+ permease